jgi:hypothetical protein
VEGTSRLRICGVPLYSPGCLLHFSSQDRQEIEDTPIKFWTINDLSAVMTNNNSKPPRSSFVGGLRPSCVEPLMIICSYEIFEIRKSPLIHSPSKHIVAPFILIMQENQIILSDSCGLPLLLRPRSDITASNHDWEFLGLVLIFASQGFCGVQGWIHDPLSGLTSDYFANASWLGNKNEVYCLV